MPLYEYECTKCGERTEAIQRSGDPLLTVCPSCGGALKKLLSAPAFQFKGSGFYVTDYGKAGEKKTGERAGEKDKEKVSSKGEEGKAPGASGGGEAPGGETKKGDSSKGGTGDAGGASGAAPSSPAPSSPAPSKKKNGDPK